MSSLHGVRWLPWLLALCVVGLATRSAAARPDDAAALVAVGKSAQRLGKYRFAIQAFKQARRLEPRPQLSFTIANAHHQRFLTKHAAYDRLQAALYYHEYLDARPRGPDRERARRALTRLEGLDEPDDDGALARAAKAETKATRLAVTSSVMGAVIELDGRKARKLPLLSTIKPGKHTLVVTAAGYRKQVRRLKIERGVVYPVHVTLAPSPAKLTVTTTDTAEVLVDGTFVGLAPFEEPIEVAPGTRRVAVLLNGYHPYTAQLKLKPGAPRELEAELVMTKRRAGAIFLIVAGAAGVGAGSVFGIASIVAEPAEDEELTPEEDKQRRLRSDDYRVVSAMAVGVGAGLSAFGGTLFVFDEPELSLEPQGPGLAGATVKLRF